MKKFFFDNKYVMIFFFALSTATVFSIADTETDQPAAHNPAEMIRANPQVLEKAFESKRQPASSAENKSAVMNVSLNCEDANKKIQKSTNDQLVMLSLTICEEFKLISSIAMTNVTNGFKAQIFKMSAKNYRTDFIQLSKGTNILLIESVLKDGHKKVQTLEILSGS
ncbi:MAG: hypothetical protein H7328_13090 [Bdellovibrio sp.]|nr:hypothetical protein [Bdellovibrio sp.]